VGGGGRTPLYDGPIFNIVTKCTIYGFAMPPHFFVRILRCVSCLSSLFLQVLLIGVLDHSQVKLLTKWLGPPLFMLSQ
jgi:hypothetical protein